MFIICLNIYRIRSVDVFAYSDHHNSFESKDPIKRLEMSVHT